MAEYMALQSEKISPRVGANRAFDNRLQKY